MNNWTIRGRIAASFAVILALMMVMATVAYTRLMRIEQLTSVIDEDSLPGLNYTHQIVVERLTNYASNGHEAETTGGHSGEPWQPGHSQTLISTIAAIQRKRSALLSASSRRSFCRI